MMREPEYISYRDYELCIRRHSARWQIEIAPIRKRQVSPHPTMAILTGKDRDKLIAEAKRRVNALYGG